MRARQGRLLGWVVVASFAALLVVASVAELRAERWPQANGESASSNGETGPEVVERFVGAWERSLNATFKRVGTYERHSEVTGNRISSQDVLVQRPPRRLHRQLGGVRGRDDDRLLLCPATPDGGHAGCELGPAGGPTYEASVEAEVDAVREAVTGSDAAYEVVAFDSGCFELDLVRALSKPPFGVEARFCFDQATGAPVDSVVRHGSGVVERVTVIELVTEVSDAELVP